MKLLKLFTLMTTLLLLSSCGEDFVDAVLGTWKLSSVEVLPGCTDDEFLNLGEVEDGCLTYDGETGCISLIILENGFAQGITSFPGGDIDTADLSYTIDPDTDIMSLCQNSDCGDVVKSGDQLRYTIEDADCDVVYIFEK